MFISEASSSLVIQSDHILQAHQIYDYSHEHEDTPKITAAVRELIRYIILTYSKESQKTSSRSISRFRSVKFTKYFEDWIITKSAKQAAFRKFREQINHYRQHSIFLKYLHTRHSERSIRSDHDKDIDRERIESVNKKFFKSISQRKKESSTSVMTFEIQNAINEAIRQYALTNPPLPGSAGSPGPAGSSVPASEPFTSGNPRWNASEVGFFDSLYDGKSISTGQAMKHARKDTYFKDVHLFIERAKDIATIQGGQHVRDNLFTCLRGSALQWYTSEISIEAKQLMRYEDEIDHWTTQLLKRFKENINVFMNIMLREQYTMKDARRRRESREYAAKILRAAKSAELESMANQIAIIYNELNVEFRRDLTKPVNVLSIDFFLREMNEVKDIWWQLTLRNSKTYDDRRRYSFKQRNDDFIRPNLFRPSPQYQRQYSSYQGYLYQNYQQSSQFRNRPQSQLSASRQSLAITNSTTATPAAPQSIYSNKYTGQASNRYENQQNKQKVYQTTVKDEENEHSMKEDAVSINFAEYDEHGNELYYEEQSVMKKDFDEVFVDFVDFETTCKHCHRIFSFNNKLHYHLRHDQCNRKSIQVKKTFTMSAVFMYSADISESTTSEIIESFVSTKDLDYDIDFRNWNFLKTLIKLFSSDIDIHVCIDIECEAIFEDKVFVKDKCSEIKIHIMTSSLRVKDIDATIHEINEYVQISLYFFEQKNDKSALTCIIREIHLVDDLKANLLIENDFLGSESFIIDISSKKASIASCEVIIDLSIRQRDSFIRRNIHAMKSTLIRPKVEINVPAKFPVSDNRDFLFEPTKEANFTLFHHVVNSYTNEIMIRNDSSHIVKIPKNFCLESVIELFYDECFQVESTEIHRALNVSRSNWIKTFKSVAAMFAFMVKSNSKQSAKSKTFSYQSKEAPTYSENQKEFTLTNGIMTYDDHDSITSYKKLIDEFPTLWKNEGFINISKNQWMRFLLREDWQFCVNDKSKIYSLELKNQKVINDTFDELQKKERLKWTTNSTSFSYLVFVAWRTINDVRKRRAIVNIRGLNKLLLSNAYSLSLQSDIISDLQECSHISVLDATSFFYQWKTHPEDTYKQTIVIFRGQKTFLVPVMSNRNSVPYVQRQMNRILREIRHFAKAFIDDIVIRFRSFNEHIVHLRTIFSIFVDLNISIKSIKIFLSYSNVVLLRQRVDALELSITDEKLKAIACLKFPDTLKELEHYLDLTEYIRNHIHYYSTIVKSLQNLKTALLKSASGSDLKRKKFTDKTKIQLTHKEVLFFETLQEVISKSSMLYHFIATKTLWIDLDTFKKFEIDVIVFHVKNDVIINKWPSRTQILSVMFLSRQLTSAELNYWFTELETFGLVWTIKKIRHLVQSSHHRVII